MRFRTKGEPLIPTDLQEFEQEIGFKLDPEYVRFLLEANGGHPEPPVGYLFGNDVNEIGGFDSLAQVKKKMPGFSRFCNGFLPIASDFGEGEICLELDLPWRVYLALYQHDVAGVRVGVELRLFADWFFPVFSGSDWASDRASRSRTGSGFGSSQTSGIRELLI